MSDSNAHEERARRVADALRKEWGRYPAVTDEYRRGRRTRVTDAEVTAYIATRLLAVIRCAIAELETDDPAEYRRIVLELGDSWDRGHTDTSVGASQPAPLREADGDPGAFEALPLTNAEVQSIAMFGGVPAGKVATIARLTLQALARRDQQAYGVGVTDGPGPVAGPPGYPGRPYGDLR